MNAPPIEKKAYTIDTKENKKSPQNDHGKMAHRMRYCILLLTTVCLSSVMSNIVVFNFTVLCMTRHHGEELPLANEYHSRSSIIICSLSAFCGFLPTERCGFEIVVTSLLSSTKIPPFPLLFMHL
uniref:Uncharacterized protein n=1 Tax=Parascaris equorum TaxID=6256 RepID=A0A914RM26_PAREQ